MWKTSSSPGKKSSLKGQAGGSFWCIDMQICILSEESICQRFCKQFCAANTAHYQSMYIFKG